MNKFTLVLDSSQITCYLTCPMQWYYRYVKRLEPIGRVEDKEAMNAGTYGHHMLDVYYRARASRLSLNAAIESALTYDPDTDICECGCKKDLHKSVLDFQECTKCKSCLHFTPHPYELGKDLREKVKSRFRDYAGKWANNDFQVECPEHVEVGFSEPIYEDDDHLFILEGRIDLLAQLSGLPCVIDHKFQLKRHWLYPRSVQFKNYAMIAKRGTMIINYVRLHKNTEEDTLARVPVSFMPHEREAWRRRLISVYFDIKAAITTGAFVTKWSACSGSGETYDQAKPRYCQYGSLCEEVALSTRASKESQLFQVRPEVWRPW